MAAILEFLGSSVTLALFLELLLAAILNLIKMCYLLAPAILLSLPSYMNELQEMNLPYFLQIFSPYIFFKEEDIVAF